MLRWVSERAIADPTIAASMKNKLIAPRLRLIKGFKSIGILPSG